jgi:hypothetical protein
MLRSFLHLQPQHTGSAYPLKVAGLAQQSKDETDPSQMNASNRSGRGAGENPVPKMAWRNSINLLMFSLLVVFGCSNSKFLPGGGFAQGQSCPNIV